MRRKVQLVPALINMSQLWIFTREFFKQALNFRVILMDPLEDQYQKSTEKYKDTILTADVSFCIISLIWFIWSEISLIQVTTELRVAIQTFLYFICLATLCIILIYSVCKIHNSIKKMNKYDSCIQVRMRILFTYVTIIIMITLPLFGCIISSIQAIKAPGVIGTKEGFDALENDDEKREWCRIYSSHAVMFGLLQSCTMIVFILLIYLSVIFSKPLKEVL